MPCWHTLWPSVLDKLLQWCLRGDIIDTQSDNWISSGLSLVSNRWVHCFMPSQCQASLPDVDTIKRSKYTLTLFYNPKPNILRFFSFLQMKALVLGVISKRFNTSRTALFVCLSTHIVIFFLTPHFQTHKNWNEKQLKKRFNSFKKFYPNIILHCLSRFVNWLFCVARIFTYIWESYYSH